MKPKEFDALIRQKFDQNDFEYSPQNWGRLEEQMDGRAKKRRIALWWLMPLMGVAASVALAIGVNTMWRFADAGNMGAVAFTQPAYDYQSQTGNTVESTDVLSANEKIANHKHKKGNKSSAKETEFGINLDNATGSTETITVHKVNLIGKTETGKKKDKIKEVAAKDGYKTFKPEAEKKVKKLSIILSGGLNQGNQNNGYAVGATVRRMINDNVFVEGAVAYANSTNTQSKLIPGVATPTNNNTPLAPYDQNARLSGQPDNKPLPKTTVPPPIQINESYSLSYIQVAPSVGCKITKHITMAAGPDFQQALVDNRPALSTVDRNNQSVAPLFDIGLVGRTEYKITKQIKAGLSYRKGINNVLTPMDKYIDRDYLQVQVHYTILNR